MIHQCANEEEAIRLARYEAATLFGAGYVPGWPERGEAIRTWPVSRNAIYEALPEDLQRFVADDVDLFVAPTVFRYRPETLEVDGEASATAQALGGQGLYETLLYGDWEPSAYIDYARHAPYGHIWVRRWVVLRLQYRAYRGHAYPDASVSDYERWATAWWGHLGRNRRLLERPWVTWAVSTLRPELWPTVTPEMIEFLLTWKDLRVLPTSTEWRDLVAWAQEHAHLRAYV